MIARRSKIKRLAVGLVPGVLACWAAAHATTVTIAELQESTAERDWRSAYESRDVSIVGGVVTHTIGFRITLQDPTLGDAWAGVELRAFENEAPLGVVRAGDRVDFYDVFVEEFRGGTIPQFKSYSTFEVISSGHPLPDPVTVPIEDLAHPPDRERCERYEGMLVAVENVRVGQMDWGKASDNYELRDGDHAIWASDYYNLDLAVPPFPTYYVSSGERYARIVGVYQEYLHPEEGWDYYQLLPRGTADYEKSDIYTIRDVQESSAAVGWRSQLEGARVSVQGVLAADGASGGALTLQDAQLGHAWAGVRIDDPSNGLSASALGDELLLQSVLVLEQDGMTRLRYDEESTHVVASTGNRIAATGVTVADLGRAAGPDASERYEGMRVALYNTVVVQCGVPEGDSLYYVASEGDTLLATDAASEVRVPGQVFFVREGDRLGRIAGVVTERPLEEGTGYVLEPRRAGDYHFMAGQELYTSWGRIKSLFR